MNFSVVQASRLNNLEDSSYRDEFPFILQAKPTELITSNNDTSFTKSIFQIRTHKFLRQEDFSASQSQTNKFFQFNVTVFNSDQSLNDTTLVQIILINKQQRVKLVFSQPLEKVLLFQDEFQKYISDLTGFKANIDRIRTHRADQDMPASNVELTDMLLHFVKHDDKLFMPKVLTNGEACPPENFVIEADVILNLLDRSNSSDLLRKYRLSLAEKYDVHGMSKFFKYSEEEPTNDYGNFFQWSTSSNKHAVSLILAGLFVILIFAAFILIVVCCCMRQRYKKKIKAERALVKAFGLDQRSLNYNDAISGYLNSAFDSSHNNGLLSLPGTNMYAYEGSNPIWLKKYDNIKVPAASLSALSSSSSSNDTQASCLNGSKTISIDSTKKLVTTMEDISAFYLKQVDSTPNASRCSPDSGNSLSNKTSQHKSEDVIMTSEVVSIKEVSPCVDTFRSHQNMDTLLTFAKASHQNQLFPATQARNFTQEINMLRAQLKSVNLNKSENKNASHNSEAFDNSNNESENFKAGSYTKIFESYQQRENVLGKDIEQGASKECSDLFAVESTVI